MRANIVTSPQRAYQSFRDIESHGLYDQFGIKWSNSEWHSVTLQASRWQSFIPIPCCWLAKNSREFPRGNVVDVTVYLHHSLPKFPSSPYTTSIQLLLISCLPLRFLFDDLRKQFDFFPCPRFRLPPELRNTSCLEWRFSHIKSINRTRFIRCSSQSNHSQPPKVNLG